MKELWRLRQILIYVLFRFWVRLISRNPVSLSQDFVSSVRSNKHLIVQANTDNHKHKKENYIIYITFVQNLVKGFSSLEQSFRGRCSVRHRIVGLSSSCGCHFELSANSITRRNRASLLARPETRGLSFSVSRVASLAVVFFRGPIVLFHFVSLHLHIAPVMTT